MEIGIIGYGNIGRTLASFFYENNHYVNIYDISKTARDHAKTYYKVFSNPTDFPETTDFIFLCLPTYVTISDNTYTYDHVFNSIKSLKNSLSPDQYVISTSTAMSGYSLRSAKLMTPFQRNYVYMPMFMREDTMNDDFRKLYPVNRLIFGVHPHLLSDYKPQLEALKQKLTILFEPLLTKNNLGVDAMIFTNYEEAEDAKILDAIHLMARISISNAFGKTNNLVKLDKRLGNYGFEAGRPFGGKCLPNYANGILQNENTPQKVKLLVKTFLEINDSVKTQA